MICKAKLIRPTTPKAKDIICTLNVEFLGDLDCMKPEHADHHVQSPPQSATWMERTNKSGQYIMRLEIDKLRDIDLSISGQQLSHLYNLLIACISAAWKTS